MTKLTLLFLLFLAGCRTAEEYNYAQHQFDPQTIKKIPLYDSLRQVLLQNLSVLEPQIKEEGAFMYNRSEGDLPLNGKMPAAAAEKINQYFAQLGDKYFGGFSVYKDSTIRYTVRDTFLERYQLNIREHISYYPNGGTMRRRKAPDKDTILNRNWHYWIRFDKEEMF